MTEEKKSPAPVGLSNEAMIEMFASAMAVAMKSSQPSAALLTGMSTHRLEVAQGKHERPVKFRIVKGKSTHSGNTFDQHVVESRTFPAGRVVRLDNYRYAPETYLPIAQGGLVPDEPRNVWSDPKNVGLPINDQTARNLFNPFFRHTLAVVWHEDLRRIVGGPLRPENCVDGIAALQTPWEQSGVHEDRAAE